MIHSKGCCEKGRDGNNKDSVLRDRQEESEGFYEKSPEKEKGPEKRLYS